MPQEAVKPADAVAGDPSAVASILDDFTKKAEAPPAVEAPRGPGRPRESAGLSMSPEAIRARRRRQLERERQGGTRDASRLTPAAMREPVQSGPVGPSPETTQRATRTIGRIISGAGLIAAMIWRDDDLRVPQADADETAGLILDGWPELLETDDADARKALAVAAVFSLVVERVGKHRRNVDAARPVRTVAAPANTAPVEGLPMAPIST